MVTGAVVTVLGTPVAASNATSAVFSIVAPDASPAVSTVTWKLTLALAPDVQATWYSQGPEGYVDYPEAEPVAA